MTSISLARSAAMAALAAAAALSAVYAYAGPGGVDDGELVWLRADRGIAAADGGAITLWADSGSNNNDAVYDAGNPFGELPPVFDASNPGVGGAPTVRFNGQNALALDLQQLAGSDYTVVVVNARDRFGLANFYIAGESILDNQNLVLGYEQEGLLRQAHFANDLDAVVEPYVGIPIWSIDTFRFAQSEGRDLYQNGTLLASDDNDLALISNTGTTIGNFRAFGGFYFYQGDVAEIVVYDRALSPQERLRVEADLARRYGRALRIEDYAPCDGGWRSQGEYLRALVTTVYYFRRAGLLTPRQAIAAIYLGVFSGCGR